LDRIADFCRRWKIARLEIFGSALRDDFAPESDIDLLVTFASDARRSLFAHVRMEDELKSMLHRNVDLVTRQGLDHSLNPVRRKDIIDSAEALYVA
jgi:hypothetical protein